MADPISGAKVLYCAHAGYFVADIYVVGNVNVVRANGKVSTDTIERTNLQSATHHLVEFPESGFWRPDLGVFVVPKAQVRKL